MDTLIVFKTLDKELKKQNIEREIVICGGAALIILGILTRQTRDVDVIIPKIDPDFSAAADAIAKDLSLRAGWLNNGPEALAKDLPKLWEKRAVEVFRGSNLIVKSLGRKDLLFSKLFAACDRGDDIDDILHLNPNSLELAEAIDWVLQKDAAEIWPKIVDETIKELKKRMGRGNK
jgi:Nucleotidyltransferase of unknown function (DUF6036)